MFLAVADALRSPAHGWRHGARAVLRHRLALGDQRDRPIPARALPASITVSSEMTRYAEPASDRQLPILSVRTDDHGARELTILMEASRPAEGLRRKR